ncbi:hypothetical protein ACFWXK_23490 [Streptomyces sp. NPDC059070]|uniref:hypothetical protein n=1 Tax=unclassified Streptomyces TaxID=2593676 RepID=UPI0034E2B039
MRKSGKIAALVMATAAAAGVQAVCGPMAQAAPTEHSAQVSRLGGTDWSATVGFSGKIISVTDVSLVLATAEGNVTLDLSRHPYGSGALNAGRSAYVSAYDQNGTWVATAIFTYP